MKKLTVDDLYINTICYRSNYIGISIHDLTIDTILDDQMYNLQSFLEDNDINCDEFNMEYMSYLTCIVHKNTNLVLFVSLINDFLHKTWKN